MKHKTTQKHAQYVWITYMHTNIYVHEPTYITYLGSPQIQQSFARGTHKLSSLQHRVAVIIERASS